MNIKKRWISRKGEEREKGIKGIFNINDDYDKELSMQFWLAVKNFYKGGEDGGVIVKRKNFKISNKLYILILLYI